MKRVWIARLYLKKRHSLSFYAEYRAGSIEELLQELLKKKHSAWVEIGKVEIFREIDIPVPICERDLTTQRR